MDGDDVGALEGRIERIWRAVAYAAARPLMYITDADNVALDHEENHKQGVRCWISRVYLHKAPYK